MNEESLIALQIVSDEVKEFINYLETVDPELKQHEATLLAAAIFKQLPTVIQNSPELLNYIRQSGDGIKHRVRMTQYPMSNIN